MVPDPVPDLLLFTVPVLQHCLDPVLFYPWSGFGIQDNFFSDLGSPTHVFESLITIFGVKYALILRQLV